MEVISFEDNLSRLNETIFLILRNHVDILNSQIRILSMIIK